MKIMKHSILLSILLASPVIADESINSRLDAKDGDKVRIENIAGTITVEAWSRNEVHVTGRLADGIEEFIFERQGDRIDIIVEWPRGGRHSRHHIDDSDLNIKVPKGVELEISSVSSDVSVTGTTGDIEVGNVSGEITVTAKAKDYRLNSVSGDIQLSGSANDARMVLETVSGELILREVHGELEANSVSGDISVRNSRIFRMRGETISGDILAEFQLEKSGRYGFEAINGDVELVTKGEPDAAFELSSFNGDIENEYGPKPKRTSKYAPGLELNFQSGNGSAQVTISTLNGDITLEKR